MYSTPNAKTALRHRQLIEKPMVRYTANQMYEQVRAYLKRVTGNPSLDIGESTLRMYRPKAFVECKRFYGKEDVDRLSYFAYIMLVYRSYEVAQQELLKRIQEQKNAHTEKDHPNTQRTVDVAAQPVA